MNIGLFNGNDTKINGYFIGMHRDLRMGKSLPAKFYSAEFNTMSLNSKISKVVSYIQGNESWERIHFLLKLLSPFLREFFSLDGNKAVMHKFFYYSRMIKISIIKSSSYLDNEVIIPLYL